MGFRIRKSKSFGPLKINLSKSGIGWSVGTKGARYTHRADGKKQTTLSIPGTGISYVDVKGKSKNSNTNYNTNNTLQDNYSSNQNLQNNNKKPPFYKRLWFMWIMLFILPPVGIALMWLFSNLGKKTKIVLSIVFGLFTLIRFSSNSNNQNLQASKPVVHSESESSANEIKTNDAIDQDKKEEIKLTGWQNSDGNSYYYDNDGNKKTGWVNDNGTYYYLNTLGIMQTGWLQDAGKWYYLNKNGSMACNTTIDGYNLASNGVMQEKAVVNTDANGSSNKSSSTASSFNNASKDVTTNESAPSEKTVYWVSGGKSYHYNRNCPTLKRSKNVLSGSASTCPKTDPCDVCAK